MLRRVAQTPLPEETRIRMPRRRLVQLASALGLLALLTLHGAAIGRANIHWDEFGLLAQADSAQRDGLFSSGARPGVAILLLLPFTAHCDDETAVIRRARWLWYGITLAGLLGLTAWIATSLPPGPGRWQDAALGMAALALVPAFLDSALQVRRDQIAFLGACWGGVLLNRSRQSALLALGAGGLFALAFIGSAKAVYLAALAVLVAVGVPLLHRELRLRRETLRGGLAALGAGATWIAYRAAIDAAAAAAAPMARAASNPAAAVAPPGGAPLTRSAFEAGISVFDFYRNTIGYSEYRALLPELVPHALWLSALAVASVAVLRRRSSDRIRFALAWACLGLGAAVALFHAAAFRYFWITLGVFPAFALAISAAPLEQRLRELSARAAGLARPALCGLLVASSLLHALLRLSDTQEVQRRSIAFVHRNFGRGAQGFHPERGLFCQDPTTPFNTYYSQHIYLSFAGPQRKQHVERLQQQFRDLPVEFVLQSFRLNQFPVELRRFWAEHYQPYSGAVFVAGRALAGRSDERTSVELLVPGRYRWLPQSSAAALRVDGQNVDAGATLELDRGPHAIEFTQPTRGLLVLALADPPGPAPESFYR